MTNHTQTTPSSERFFVSLFILCAEGLCGLIKYVEASGELHGVKICRNTLIITQILFADDYFLFFREGEAETQNMKQFLTLYGATSGYAISHPKSEIYYSLNAQQSLQNAFTTTLGGSGGVMQNEVHRTTVYDW